MNQSEVIKLPSSAMDVAIYESRDEFVQAGLITQRLAQLGFNYHNTMRRAEAGEVGAVSNLHNLAALLNSEWEHQMGSKKESHELKAVVAARLFNKATQMARKVEHGVGQPVEELKAAIKSGYAAERAGRNFDIIGLAQATFNTARKRGHENTWKFTVLPSRYGQPYASLALGSVASEDTDLPATWITQIKIANSGMFSHVHGLSGAFAAPNGSDESPVNLRNIIWGLGDTEDGFPPKVIRKDSYSHQNVVYIPPRMLHSIVVPRELQTTTLPSLEEMLETSNLAKDVLQSANFGVKTCTHVYRPIKEVVQQFSDTPYDGVWKEMGTLVLDHHKKQIYAGNNHAMDMRGAFQSLGKCCGVCTSQSVRFEEEDNRKVIPLDTVRNFIVEPFKEEQIPIYTL